MSQISGDTPTVVLTGVTGGLGRASVVNLARRGAHLVLLARNPEAAARVAAEADAAGSASVDVVECDLSVMSSVRSAAADIAARPGRPDVLVSIAAAVAPVRTVTAEGNELMLATNYVGPWLLTQLVLGSLPQNSGFRFIAVGGPLKTKPDLADLDCAQGFAPLKAFERSKTALNLFTAAAPRHSAIDLRAVIYAPGLMKTGLSATLTSATAGPAGTLMGKFLPSPAGSAEGLASLIWSTDLSDVAAGTVFDRHGKTSPMPLLNEVSLQENLWEQTRRRLDMPE